MKKRILTGLLVAAMLLASLPTAAFAADDTNAEAPDTGETQTILPKSEEDAEQSTVTAPSYCFTCNFSYSFISHCPT